MDLRYTGGYTNPAKVGAGVLLGRCPARPV